MQPTVMIVPGYDNSGPGHWQTLWEAENPGYIRIHQRDWLRPLCAEWVQTLDEAIRWIMGPKLLIGHSLGCSTIVEWAKDHRDNIVGALLVAPPDLASSPVKNLVNGFPPISLKPLPFPSIVVASTNDPYGSWQTSKNLASLWGSRLVTLESAGHINIESGHGPWPEGKKLLQEMNEEIRHR